VRFEIQGETRDGSGRAANRKLRNEGRLPAIVYGGGKDPSAVSLDHNRIFHQMEREAFFTTVLTLKVGSTSHAVIVKDVQRHPAKPIVLHMDFQRVLEDEAITLSVPIHFVGEESAKGVKDEGGQLEHSMTDIEVSCLPGDLPEFIEVDVTALALNEILHLSDVKFPAGVSSVALAHDQDRAVVSIHPPRRQEVDETATEEAEAADAAVKPDAKPGEPAAD
jgi:large subunit ribosomal protein L25